MREDKVQTAAEVKDWVNERALDKVQGDRTIQDQWKTLKAVAVVADQLVILNKVFEQANIASYDHLLSDIEKQLRIMNIHLGAITGLDIKKADING